MNYLHHIGAYFLMLREVFKKPQKWKVFWEMLFREIDDLGLKSLGITAFISFFVGGVVSIQTALSVESPFIPKYLIGFATRQSVVLEFAPTFISIIMAGKMGSFITSSIGTMRVTEQIDALEIMGINPATFLILPKIVASMIINPFLIMMSMILAVGGGWLAGIFTGLFPSAEYIYGIQSFFHLYDILQKPYLYYHSVIHCQNRS